MKKKLLIVVLSCLSLLSSCGNESLNSSENIQNDTINITINLSNDRKIRCELYPSIAPITVSNFIKLIDEKFYDGTVFHRVIPSFMIQGGGYYIQDRVVYKKDAQTIKGEFSNNGIKNDLKHTKGVLSMARLGNNYDSASSEFFICVENCSWLDGDYASFGKVRDEESLSTIIDISKVYTVNIGGGLTDFPYEPILITNVTKD